MKKTEYKIGCVIMASGLGVRFGGNKLMAEFQGQSLFEHVLELIGQDLFAKCVVVTRNEEVRKICEQRNREVVFHQFPDRNDTVRLGILQMEDMDGCMFCPCDQPLLRRESLEKMIEQFGRKKIIRLSYGEHQGTPVLFGNDYFRELAELPPKKGGGYLIKKYPEYVECISATSEWELFDIDTKDDYEVLCKKGMLLNESKE